MSDFPPSDPRNDPRNILVGSKAGVLMFNKSYLDVWMQMPLPGITIFVHGINSDGEWFDAAEQGLCDGLNERLKRCDHHLCHTGTEAGQLSPTEYIKELTPDGFINPEMSADSFIQGDDTFSPVIRFRYGYKATGEELQRFGNAIFLNEQDYWGGGPFANGCTSLPDLWGDGLEEELFLWLHVQHVNPTPDRQVYSCPPRPYFVLAAYRLAKLVEAIRQKQADVPITLVCHSQGNMVGICAAFLGDRFDPAVDALGRTSSCVADTYVLCNPPYSLVDTNTTDNWTQRHATDAHGNRGRQTYAARTQTLAAFFDIIRQRKSVHQAAARIDRRMANEQHGFGAQQDRDQHGLDGSTYGRVTLYCNPHDQVISATTVQGIGWRGMSAKEIEDTRGQDLFRQRVFAQGFEVGQTGEYDYWAHHYRQPLSQGSQDFWFPQSPQARYDVVKGLDANEFIYAKILTILSAPFAVIGMAIARTRINALPPNTWRIPLSAPSNFEPFLPQSVRYGAVTEQFDQYYDAPGSARNIERERAADDPYAGTHHNERVNDAPVGDEDTEASLLYEQHAALRMKAKRAGRYANDQKVTEEDQPDTASDDYKSWREDKIKTMLVEGLDAHATDHSTILTNPMHARRVLAYDVAIGNCDIYEIHLRRFRILADWRFAVKLVDDNPWSNALEYFNAGKLGDLTPFEWTRQRMEGSMPEKIIDERQGSWYLGVGGMT